MLKNAHFACFAHSCLVIVASSMAFELVGCEGAGRFYSVSCLLSVI